MDSQAKSRECTVALKAEIQKGKRQMEQTNRILTEHRRELCYAMEVQTEDEVRRQVQMNLFRRACSTRPAPLLLSHVSAYSSNSHRHCSVCIEWRTVRTTDQQL